MDILGQESVTRFDSNAPKKKKKKNKNKSADNKENKEVKTVSLKKKRIPKTLKIKRSRW
jgi:hypothetical protein